VRRIRILLADEQSVFREGLVMQLNKEKDFEAVAGMADDVSFVELVRSHEPDILLYDIKEDAAHGFLLLREIRRVFVERMPVAAFSDLRAKSAVRGFLDAGGAAYVLKSSPFDEYKNAIRSAARGQKYICQELTAELVMERPSENQIIYNSFTAKRKKVLQLFAGELSIKEIAAHLRIDIDTVEYHIRVTINKLNLSGPIELYKILQTMDLD